MHREFARSFSLALAAPAVTILGVLAGEWWTGTAGTIARIVAGVPLVFVVPGWALTTALWPRGPGGNPATARRPGPAIGNLERWTWSVGLSIAVAVIGGLLLNLLPGGLTPTSWLVSLGAVAIIAATVGAAREHTAGHRPGTWRVTRRNRGVPGYRQAGAYVAAGAIAASALWLAYHSAASVTHPGFTQLWLVPQTNRSNDLSSATRAQLGVGDHEPGYTHYRLVLHNTDQVIATWSFTLITDDVWQRMVPLPRGQQLAADLYRNGSSRSYRTVVLHGQNLDRQPQ